MMREPAKIKVISLSGWREEKLKSFFQLECDGAYEIISEQADLLIADLDNFQDHAQLTAFTDKHPDLPTILVSFDTEFTRTPQLSNVSLLKKPYQLNEIKKLLASMLGAPENQEAVTATMALAESAGTRAADVAALAEAAADLAAIESTEARAAAEEAEAAVAAVVRESVEVAAAEVTESRIEVFSETVESSLKYKSPYPYKRADVDLSDPKEVEKLRYDSSKFLYGYLAKIAIQDDGEELVGLTIDKAVFIFSSDKKTVKINLSDSKLYALSSVPIYDESANISSRLVPWGTIVGKEYPIKELLWDTAIWAARCRLELATDLNKPVALARWPNMTRLRNFPHAAQVAALWVKQPTSLIDTASVLDIPQRDVFSFYVATQAIGESYYVADTTKPASVTKRKKSGLFSRILEHLKGTDETDEEL